VQLQQPIEAVEIALADYLQREVLVPGILDRVLAEVRAEAERRLTNAADVTDLEADLRQARTEVKNLMKLGAMAGDDAMAEIANDLKERTAVIKRLEADLAAARRCPAETVALIDQIEKSARDELHKLRSALLDDPGAREVYRALFPGGLVFEPVQVSKVKRVRAISGTAHLSGSTLNGDPSGI
jgi:uncharacterized protein YhaN